MTSNGYPKLTLKAWRVLRSRAAAAPSTKFTPATVAAVMGMASPRSASNNTVLPMRRLGLIDDDGALTARGNKWRIDASYVEACQEILDEVYPPDLPALTDVLGAPDQKQLKTWFDHKGFGESNARQMTATYVMIAIKELPEPVPVEPKKVAPKKVTPKKATATARTVSTPNPSPVTARPEATKAISESGPNVHLDIQIHIPADASVEQIDQIFESMSRHLYKR